MGRVLCGLDLQKSLRRHAKTRKRRLWKLEIRMPTTNRLINGTVLLSWGADGGRVGRKDAILLGDCSPLDSITFDNFKLAEETAGDHGRPPETMYMFIKMGREQSRLYAAIRIDEHLEDRLPAIDGLSGIRGDFPEFPTSTIIAVTRGRVAFRYNICVGEGVRYVIGQYDEFITFDILKRSALTPGSGCGEEWRYIPSFDFGRPGDPRQMAVLPEIQQEGKRQGAQSLVAERANSGEHPSGGKNAQGRKGGDVRNGGDEGKTDDPQPHGVEKPKSACPTGPTLNAMEKRIGYPHRPMGRDGRVLRYKSSDRPGCATANFSFPQQPRAKPDGLQWTASYEIDRRGCLADSKRIEPQSSDGCLRALSEKTTIATRRAIGACRNAYGRSSNTKTRWARESEGAKRRDSQDGEEEVDNIPLAVYTMGRGCDTEDQIKRPIRVFQSDRNRFAKVQEAPLSNMGNRNLLTLYCLRLANTAIWKNVRFLFWNRYGAIAYFRSR